MKALPYLLSVVVGLTFFSSSCKKHVLQPVDQLSLLPAATQTGAGTFGCLINGRAFIPNNQSLLEGPSLQCNYIFTKGGYYFVVGSSHKNSDGSIIGINVETDSLKISDGRNVTLTQYNVAGKAFGTYTIFSTASLPFFHTDLQPSGQLIITHFDTVKQIVSGTFYFNAVNSLHDTVKVTGGRFDMPYTR